MANLGKLKEYLLPVCLIFFTVCLDGRPITKNLVDFCKLPKDYPVKDAMYFHGGLHCCNCPIGQEVERHCRMNEPLSTICRDKTIQPTELPPVSPNVLVPPYNVTQTTTANNSLGRECDKEMFVCPDNTWKDVLLGLSVGLNVILIIILCLAWKHMKKGSCKENRSVDGANGTEEDSDTEASGSNDTIAETVPFQRSVEYNATENLNDEAESLTGTEGISINRNEHGGRH